MAEITLKPDPAQSRIMSIRSPPPLPPLHVAVEASAQGLETQCAKYRELQAKLLTYTKHIQQYCKGLYTAACERGSYEFSVRVMEDIIPNCLPLALYHHYNAMQDKEFCNNMLEVVFGIRKVHPDEDMAYIYTMKFAEFILRPYIADVVEVSSYTVIKTMSRDFPDVMQAFTVSWEDARDC